MSPAQTSASPLDLLRQLGSGVRPDGLGAPRGAQNAGVEQASFDELLSLARSGNAAPGEPLGAAKDVRVDLSEALRAALTAATDAAEAQGATRLGVQAEGSIYTIDVTRREIVDVKAAQPGAIVTGVDAFVALDASGTGAESERAAGARVASLGTLPGNGSLALALLRGADQRAG
ncbi:MAG: hypothetical protein ACTS27_09710 [Phycisphaerales bacterium]